MFFHTRHRYNTRFLLLNYPLFSHWCFTHQYKNTTQFYFYAALLSSQNTNQNRTAIIKAGYAQFSNIKWAASASYTCVVSDQNIKKSDILLTGIRIVGSTAENYGLRFWVDDGYISCNCTSLIAGNNTTVGFWYLLIRSAISE